MMDEEEPTNAYYTIKKVSESKHRRIYKYLAIGLGTGCVASGAYCIYNVVGLVEKIRVDRRRLSRQEKFDKQIISMLTREVDNLRTINRLNA